MSKMPTSKVRNLNETYGGGERISLPRMVANCQLIRTTKKPICSAPKDLGTGDSISVTHF